MEHEHIIGGLLSKRADIAGEIATVHTRLRDLQADLAHVEATLRLFVPDIDISGARVSRKPGAQPAGYGEMSKAVRDVLREATGPLTVKEIAERVAERRGITEPDWPVLLKRVGAALRNSKRRGQAENRHAAAGLAMVWEGVT